MTTPPDHTFICTECKCEAPAYAWNPSGRCMLCEPLNEEQQAFMDEVVAKAQEEGVAFMRSRGIKV